MWVKEKIVVVNLGSQQAQSIVRQIRNLGVYSEMVNDLIVDEPSIKGYVVLGSDQPLDNDKPQLNSKNLDQLSHFIFDVCQMEKNWSVQKFVSDQIEKIQSQVKDSQVICGLSGGVDSSVTAALLQRAIGDQLTCIFVDHGLMRKDEGLEVKRTFVEHFNVNLVYVDAQKRFLSKLENVTDPEEKRKIIGHEFISVFEEETRKLQGAKFLGQGTLYTDVIESGTNHSEVIKSHHNVGGLPKDMNLSLIEPLDSLFKDEAREVGLFLGLPQELIYRQPFPGPGLGIRITGAITEDKVRMVQESDYILREEIKKAKLNIWQYFTVLTNTKTVGTFNNKRTYEHALAIRAVDSVDGMTADYARIPYDVLTTISNRIIHEVDGINRVVYDITSKPPGTIEWE